MTWKAQNIPSVPNPLGIQREGRLTLRHRWVREGAEGQSPPRAGVPRPPAPVTGAKAAGDAAGMLGRSSAGKEGGKAAAEHAGSRSMGGGDPLPRGAPACPACGASTPRAARRTQPVSGTPGVPWGQSPSTGMGIPRGRGGGSRFPERGAQLSPQLGVPPVLPSHAVTAGRRFTEFTELTEFPVAALKVRERPCPGAHTEPLQRPSGAAPAQSQSRAPGLAGSEQPGRGTAPQGTDHLVRAGAAPAAFGILGMVLSLEHNEAVQAPAWNETRAGSLGWAAREKEQNGFLRGEGGTELGARREPPWRATGPALAPRYPNTPGTARPPPPLAARSPGTI